MPTLRTGQSKDLTPAERINKEHEKMRRKEDEKRLKEQRKMDAEELKDREKEKELWAKIKKYQDKKPSSWTHTEVERDTRAARRAWFEKIVSNNDKYGHAPKDVDFELDRLQYFDWMFHDIYRPGPLGGITVKVREAAQSQGKGKAKEVRSKPLRCVPKADNKKETADMYFDLVPSAIRNALWNDPLLTELKDRIQAGTRLTFANKYQNVYNAEAEISNADWVQGIDTVEDGEARQGLLKRMHEYHSRLSVLWTLRFAHDTLQEIHMKESDELRACVENRMPWKDLKASNGGTSYVEAGLKAHCEQHHPFQA